MNKKGVSGIVATLITILLVLVASGVIYVVSMNLISDYREDITNESSSLLDTCASKHYSVMTEGDLCNSSVVSLHNQICCPSFYFNTSNGLVSYWSFDENANDDYGNNDGTVTGATWNATGGVNGEGAYEFDGSGDYINIGASNNIIPNNNSWTISTWFKSSYIKTGDIDNRIITLFRGVSSGTGVSLGVGGSIYTRLLYFRTNTINNILDINSPTELGKWYNFVVTYDGTNFISYINGTKKSTYEDIFYGVGTPDAHIGAFYSSSNFFNGTIDEVRIYNRALSETEVKLLYDNFN